MSNKQEQEPTVEELLQIMLEMMDFTIVVLSENRTLWRNFFNGKYTNYQSYTEREKLRDEIEKLNKDINAQYNKVTKHFEKYKHLLDFKEKK